RCKVNDMVNYLESRPSQFGVALLLLAFNAGCGDGDTDGSANGGSANGGSAGKGGTANGGSAGKGGTASGGVSNGGSGASSGSGGSTTPGVPVALGGAEDYVILAKAGISTVPTSAITGNLGVSPAAASYITGFSLIADATNAYSSSPQVTGKVYAADYASPTPSDLTTAVGDMELAFTTAAGRAPDVTELGAGDIGGMTLEPGVYQWGTGLLIPTDITLAGSATAVWIFQVAQDLTVSSATSVVLSGGALAKNVFWQVSGEVTLGTTAHFEGVVLSQTSVTLGTGASINGRLLAQTAVTLDGSTLVEPAE
ncbi:MAG TPA: ice-binding family protein, partial [Polyangiaceae bacterium]|nr:ice-binding family protein [Polyangiaceae bacterium]